MNCIGPFNPGEKRICCACFNHRQYHPRYDPRCVVCVVERIKAVGKAVVIMIWQMVSACAH
jgi:hypothetical protein